MMETSELRLQLMRRARFRCECGGADLRGCPKPAAELDHFFGRAKAPESAENCWMMSTDCHKAKTDGNPKAAEWLRRFIAHCTRQMNRGRMQSIEELDRWETAAERAIARRVYVLQRDDFAEKLKRR